MIEDSAAPLAILPPGRDSQIESVTASAYRIPTDKPEADGTYEWSSTTLVLVEVTGAGKTGLGYTYADASIVPLISGPLLEAVKRYQALDPPAAWRAMTAAVHAGVLQISRSAPP